MQKSPLKQLAQTAKHRMKNGYSSDEFIDRSTIASIEKEEKRVFEKIMELKATGEEIFNPLGQLVDHTIFDNLDQIERERYILVLSNTYLKMLKKYQDIN